MVSLSMFSFFKAQKIILGYISIACASVLFCPPSD